jgi:hypothetical protein
MGADRVFPTLRWPSPRTSARPGVDWQDWEERA